MKKLTIITGHQGSGKTTTAKEYASKFKESETQNLLYSNYKSSFYYSQCDENTKLIIIEGVTSICEIIPFLFLCSGIEVNKKGKSPFTINPEILLVCQGYEELHRFFGLVSKDLLQIISLD
jgi:Cdc6-like AAA superfamily ATPase